jgi:dethiobiotin synthetase
VTAKSPTDPSSADITKVVTRLPTANVVLTGRPGSKGFTFPPLPGRVQPAIDATAPANLPAAASAPSITAAVDVVTVPENEIQALPEQRTETHPTDSAPAEPMPAEPQPAEPTPAEPAPTDPLPEGAPVSPAPTGPALKPDDLPTTEALSAEIAAELAAQTPPAAQPAPRRPDSLEWRGIVLVTGTDTDVGKTIVTAAVAAAAQASGLRVAVIKPGQTGIATGAPTDIEVVNRLAGPATTRTLAEYPEPMAPLAAATIASMPPLELYEVVDAIRAEADKHDLVLVEGAGGLLVPMGVRPSGEPWTVADLATALGVSTIVVTRAGLGTLNHTALTLEALNRRGIPAGVVIGSWPANPDLVHWANLSDMVPHLLGALPAGAGRMDPGVFQRSAPGWLTPSLYGVLDNWRVWAEENDEGHH